MEQKNRIPVVMICDRNFVMQTSVAIESLYRNKKMTTEYEVFILLADCSGGEAGKLEELQREGLLVHIINVELERYQNIKQLAHVPLASCLKFDISDLIPQYDKLLYLDGDIIVRADLTDLYETDLKDYYVAGVPHSLGIITGEKKLNGGVLLFNAAKIRKEKLREVFIRTRQSLGDRKSMDQETFHLVFGDRKLFLKPCYNVMIDKVEYEKKYYTMHDYNTFFDTSYRTRKDLVKEARIIHFTGSIKPWKYKFAACGKEWRYYYRLLYGDEAVLSLKGRSAYYKGQIAQNGVRCIYWEVKDKVLEILGEVFHVFPDKSHGQWN